MTVDFAILMPQSKKGGLSSPTTTAKTDSQNSLLSTCHQHQACPQNSSSSSFTKWLFITTFIFMLGLTVITTGLLVKYENSLDKLRDQVESGEGRILALETDLDRIIKMSLIADAEEVMEYETHAGNNEFLNNDHYDDDEEEEDDEDFLEMVELKPTTTTTPQEFQEEDSSSEELFRLRQEEESENFGQVHLEDKDNKAPENEPRSRSKRQIPFPNVPTFGPEVERTDSGVPIVQQSYLANAGVTLKPRPQYHYSRTTTENDSEGLRLYDQLVERGSSSPSSSSRLRNLDSSSSNTHYYRQQGQQSSSTLLPHHQVSAAWSEPSHNSQSQTQLRPTASRIQLKSGDNSGYGSSETSNSGTGSGTSRQYSRRSQHYSSGSSSSRPISSSTNSNSNVLVSTSSGSSGATYHRNSRVPSTGEFFYPSGTGTDTSTSTTSTKSYGGRRNSNSDSSSSSSNDNTRIQYPPLRKLNVGNGEGEVIARVLQTERDYTSTTDDRDNALASANLGDSDATALRQVYRARHHNVGYPLIQTGGGSSGGGGLITSHAQTQSFSGRTGGGGEQQRRRNSGGRRVSQTQNDDDDSGEISIVKAEAWVEGPKPLAAHYISDVSNYTTSHRHYDGNGRLRNADGIFEAWRPADWMTTEGSSEGSKSFVLSPTGVLTVKKAGLYYIYAQIHYLDEHDINGFIVQVNTNPFLQCTTMTETYSGGSKSNSCFTAGIQYLKADDRIVIKDIETNRYSIFKPEKSFFGLMKVGAVP